MMTTDKKVIIEITREACDQLRYFLMNDREGTGEGYSDFILISIDTRRQLAALTAERDALRAAHQKLSSLAREVSRQYSDTSWNIGAIRKLTEYIDNKDNEKNQEVRN